MSTSSLHEWFQRPLGAYLLARERAWLDEIVPNIFGYHAVQLGLAGVDLLRESRMVHRLTVVPGAERAQIECAEVGPGRVFAEFEELPLASDSIDLCLLPHLFEFADNPHAILREVDRVIRPEGRILILGFNPWSLFGVRRLWSTTGMPWQGHFVSLVRIKDWLQLLGFEASAGKLTCYIPPCETPLWQQRWQFLERAGDRWWGVSGGVYMLEAIKRTHGMRLITPTWRQQRAHDRQFAAATNRDGRVRSITRVEKNGSRLRLVK